MLDVQINPNDVKSQKLRPHLGLVCVTHSDKVRFRTITRTRYLKLSESERNAALRDIYTDNLSRVQKALTFCSVRGIHLYRLSSDLFPFNDDMLGAAILEEMAAELAKVGQRAAELNLRLVLHPDQFVVLNSDNPQIIETSIMLLERFTRMLDLMQLPQTAYTTMMIHGGKGDRAERLIDVVKKLPESIRDRLAFENDENSYSAEKILEICRAAHVPMVLDAHHDVCNQKMDSYDDPRIVEMVCKARETWPKPEWQLVHLSNGKEFFNDRRHSDMISVVPNSYFEVPWVEVEAKAKEEAIAQIRTQWPQFD